MVTGAYDAVVGGKRSVCQKANGSYSPIQALHVWNTAALRKSRLWDMVGQRSADKRVPEWMWHSPAAVKRVFLQSLFEGDGSCSALPRNTIQISYSSRSEQLAKDVQQMLLEFGVVSKRYRHSVGEYKVVITNRAQAESFAAQVGFGGAKQDKLREILSALPETARGLDTDH